jgi:hypothetical protein
MSEPIFEEVPKIEQIARAMWRVRQEYCRREYAGIAPLEDWGDGSIPRANGIFDEALAALEAMRTPTRAMVAAGDAILGEHTIAESGWYHVMIDAALSEPALPPPPGSEG